MVAILGGGCFWCTEAIFRNLKGVLSVMPGYMGGEKENPTYEEVSSQNTGYIEVIQIDFDDNIISYEDLLNVFFHIHNPTTLNQQGNDIGAQYASVIFYMNDSQRKIAEKIINDLTEAKAYEREIVTKVLPSKTFFQAEEYHRNYYERNKTAPYCEVVIAPKLKKLNERFSELVE